ncbi:serine/threonine receptor-like kinase NFP [Actinidia eriantha]|uniref:serine/threonine receptor-like kinase NFP n=1 Tax=Actinidia eriantha TaxID=165200 RepID=UPI00258FAED2|nr:serine/threonine receptor-like kinase NFP [Actinidia eriantha]
MELSPISLSFITVFSILLFRSPRAGAQSPADRDTDFSCSSDFPISCQTYLTYRARAPLYLDLGNISDLFNISRLAIAKASTLASENAQLIQDQLLLIPITCTCNGTQYFSNFTYQIKDGDSFYVVSTFAFENLTNYHLVQEKNSKLNPINLHVGDEVIFPLLCKCPRKNDSQKGIQNLITYVWQPSDDVSTVSSMFNASFDDIFAANNDRNFTAAVYLPVLIPVSQLPVFPQPLPSPVGQCKSKHRWTLVIVLCTGGVFLSLVAAFLAHIHLSSKKKKSLNGNVSALETDDLIQMEKARKEEAFEPKVIQDKLLPGISGYLDKPTVYDKKVIMEATTNLSERYRIGKSVYRAVIEDRVFAVKKTKDATEELKILQKVNHANLVKLMGMSSDNQGNCFLVYEYAENGSLDKWLYPKSSSISSSSVAFLTWTQRLYIAFDVANGLQYMHEHTQPSVVHRDIRTTNILLSARFKAKISNFSIARPATNYVMPKIDVFAFGVVLLELLAGRKAMETTESGEIVLLWKEIRWVLEDEEKREERLMSWMDPKLESFYPIDGALSVAGLARACTSEKYSARPRMAEIVFNLSVLTQSSQEMNERSSTSAGMEAEDVVQVISPVVAAR